MAIGTWFETLWASRTGKIKISLCVVFFALCLISCAVIYATTENVCLIPKTRSKNDPHSITSCSDAMEILPSPRSKNQTIYLPGNGNCRSLEVLCDYEVDGGGWTIIQKRTSGPKQEFQKNWNDYVKGFGSLDKNFWIGLENIHTLTKNGDQELRIELEDFEGDKRWAKYSSFSVSDASDFYRLSIKGFYGGSTAGNSMTDPDPDLMLNGMKFSTMDKDNDKSMQQCSMEYGGGGWWFNRCGRSGLNGAYFEKGRAPQFKGVLWSSWDLSWGGGWYISLAKTEMKIRTRK